jgi:Na+/alanine symporter
MGLIVPLIVAFIVLLVVAFIALGGVLTRSMINRIKWNTKKIFYMKPLALAAYLVILFTYAIIFLGIKYIAEETGKDLTLALIHLCLFFFILVVLEEFFYKFVTSGHDLF